MTASIKFPTSYQESREIFQEEFKRIQKRWPNARMENRQISEEGLQTEWIAADAVGEPRKVLVITSAIHGMEGFVGAGMRSLFINEFLDALDPEETGLYLIHAINPWGMRNNRRVTRNNVDLNRNFALDVGDFQEGINPEYQLYDHILNPDRPLRSLWLEIPALIARLIAILLRAGVKNFRNAVLQGQRNNPQGLYYAGKAYEPETLIVMDLIKEVFSDYQDVLLIDMHTGYGPKYQMSIVISPGESRSSAQLREAFQYPLVLKADSEEFYVMQGDMVNWLYEYRRSAGLQGKFYGVAFEFGTIGETVPHEVISLWNVIFENQVVWKGALKGKIKTRIQETSREMYFPSEEKWRERALADCRQALGGILRHEGYID